jgi:lycopene beta-cyclase
MTNNSHFFDYIITGFGCAGMSLVYYLIESKLKGKNILIIENAQKTRNDRTWCYWAEKPLDIHPKKSPLVFWEQIEISNGSHSVKKPLDKLKYYHIQSSDFYHEILEKIKAYPNIKFLQDSVISFEEFGNNKVNVKTQNNGIYTSLKVFDSIPKYKIDATNSKMLQQIFVGWKIKTPNKQFDKHTAVMMDFDNYNKNQTAFFYVLPFSEDEALLEYTVFSTEKIEKEMMESHLKRYIDENLKERDYEITFREERKYPYDNF